MVAFSHFCSTPVTPIFLSHSRTEQATFPFILFLSFPLMAPMRTRQGLKWKFGKTRCEPYKMDGWSLEGSIYSSKIPWAESQSKSYELEKKNCFIFFQLSFSSFLSISRNNLPHKVKSSFPKYCFNKKVRPEKSEVCFIAGIMKIQNTEWVKLVILLK